MLLLVNGKGYDVFTKEIRSEVWRVKNRCNHYTDRNLDSEDEFSGENDLEMSTASVGGNISVASSSEEFQNRQYVIEGGAWFSLGKRHT